MAVAVRWMESCQARAALLLPSARASSRAHDGRIALEFHWPPGIPGGTSIVFQYAILDAAAVQGAALSNALRADVP